MNSVIQMFMFKLVFVLVFAGIARSLATPRPDAPKPSAGESRLAWHVGVYSTERVPYKYNCGGSVIRTDVVISVAQCFYEKSPRDFVVVGDKNHLSWDDPNDAQAQKSDVAEIFVPSSYRSLFTNYQSDIALLRLATPFRYTRGLRTVCVDFDEDFEGQQLRDGNRGTIAGCGSSRPDGPRKMEVPYMDTEKCIVGLHHEDSNVVFITWDKFCAGNGTDKICNGDSGNGLVFWRGEPAVPYLRGLVSTASPRTLDALSQASVAAYTRISSHRRFLLEYLPRIDQECRYAV